MESPKIQKPDLAKLVIVAASDDWLWLQDPETKKIWMMDKRTAAERGADAAP